MTTKSKIPITAVWKVLQKMAQTPVIRKAVGVVLGWFGKKITQNIIDKNISKHNNSLNKINTMDKGFFSNKTQEWVLAKVKELLKSQKPLVILGATLAVKLVFLYADDNLAENNLPQDLTDKCQQFFDALVDNKMDEVLALGVELVAIIYALIQAKPAPEVKVVPPKK